MNLNEEKNDARIWKTRIFSEIKGDENMGNKRQDDNTFKMRYKRDSCSERVWVYDFCSKLMEIEGGKEMKRNPRKPKQTRQVCKGPAMCVCVCVCVCVRIWH